MYHKEKKTNKNQLVFGIRAVMEAIESGKEIEKLLVQKGLRGELFQELYDMLKAHHIFFQQVPAQALNRITQKNHQGVIAYLSPISYASLEDEIPFLYEQGKTPFVLMLDRITDVRNFGALARSAECSGVDLIVLPARGSAIINEDAIKTSAGALHKIKVARVQNMKASLDFLKQSGLRVLGVSEHAEVAYYEQDMRPPTVVLLGSEEDGISEAYNPYLDAECKIPMAGTIASLNVSVAGGILMFEGLRQRTAKK